MSHNKIKVGGQSPSASGEISVALDNLSNVSASTVEEGALRYVNSSFKSSLKPSTQYERYYSFIKTSDDYGTTLSYSNNDYWIWRHSSGVSEYIDASITRNTATTANSPVSNSLNGLSL